MAALAQKEAFLRLLWMRHKRHPKRKHKYQWGSGTCTLGNTCSQAYWHEASWMTKRPKIRTKKRGFHCRSCWQRGAEWEAEESWQGWQRAPEIRGGWQAAAAPRVHASWRWSLGNKETRALSSLLLTAAEASLFADVGWSITAGLPGRSLCRGQDPYLQPAQSISATHPAALLFSPGAGRQRREVPSSSGRTTCFFQQGAGKWRQTRSAKQTALGQPEIGNGMKAPWPCSEPCCLPRFPLLLFQLTCRYPIVIFEMKVHSDRAVTGCLFNHESLDQMVFCCNVIAWCQGFTQDLYSSSSAGHFLARKTATCWEMAIKEKKDLA